MYYFITDICWVEKWYKWNKLICLEDDRLNFPNLEMILVTTVVSANISMNLSIRFLKMVPANMYFDLVLSPANAEIIIEGKIREFSA